jgi:hypothetical protein
MVVEDRLYGRWRSFVWALEVVGMAASTAMQTISNGHTNDQTQTAIPTTSNAHTNDLRFVWALEVVGMAV